MSKIRPWQKLELIPANDRKKLLTSGRGKIIHKDYAFGKKIDKNELENVLKTLNDGLDPKEWKNGPKSIRTYKRIKILDYPFEPVPLAKSIPIDPVFWKEAFAQARLYLLGTQHRTSESILDVQNLMQATQPDIVFIELCATRAINFGGLISFTDEEIDKEYGSFDKFLHKFIEYKHPDKKLDDFGWIDGWLLKKQATKKFNHWNSQKNSEFRAAFEMARKVRGCAGVVLGELPHSHVEFTEEFNSLNVLDNKNEGNEKISEKLAKRDRHMIKVMHTILHRCTLEKLCGSYRIGVTFEPLTVVGIVGFGHLEGIERLWSKQEELYVQK